MTETDFKRMCKAIEANRYFCVAESNGYTEIIKHSQYDYAVYSVVGAKRNCVDTAYTMQELKYLFV